MSALQFPVPWDIQPQELADIDWDNPDAQGLTLVYVPSIFNGNLISKTPALATPDKTANADGVAAYWGAAFSAESAILTSAWSWVALFRTRTIGTGSNRYVLSRGPTSVSDSTGFGFAAFHGNAAYSGAVFTTDAYSIIGKPTGGPLADNTRYLLGATFAGGSGAVYNNGVETATATGLSGTVNNTGRLALGESSLVAGNAMSQNAEWAVYLQWNRRLDAAAMARVHVNPWKLLRPRTIWVPVSAAGGGVTLGASSSTQTSTSSAAGLAQTHTLGAGAGTQAQTSSATGLSQTHTLGAGASTQARTSSATGLSQTHALGAAGSTQARTSSATGLGQTHALGNASSTQASTSSATGLTLGTVTVLGNASSVQGTVSTSTGLSQTHALGNASSLAATGSAATAVVQRHVLGNAASTQASSAATGIYLGTGPVTYPLAGASQGYPLAGQSQDYPLAGIAQTYPLKGQL